MQHVEPNQVDLIRQNNLVLKSTIVGSSFGVLIELTYFVAGYQSTLLNFYFLLVALLAAIILGVMNRSERYRRWVSHGAMASISLISLSYIYTIEDYRGLFLLYCFLIISAIYRQRRYLAYAFGFGITAHGLLFLNIQVPFEEWPVRLLDTVSFFVAAGMIVYFSQLILKDYLMEIINEHQRMKRLNESLEVQQVTLVTKNQSLESLNQMKDHIISNVSNELNTPLQAIMGTASSVLDGGVGPLTSPIRKQVQFMLSNSYRLSSTIQDILDFSRLREGKMACNPIAFDLKNATSLLIEQLKPLITTDTVQLENQLNNQELPAVYADPKHFQQIFRQLISNAIKFTDKGKINITAKVIDQNVILTIRDTGIGMNGEQLKRLFDPFEIADSAVPHKKSGIGLGLAIVKQLMEQNSGTIRVESEIGKGSVFTLTFPQAATEAVPNIALEPLMVEMINQLDADHAGEEIRGTGEDGFILVVDDEPINLQVMSNLLERSYARIKLCSSGIEALANLKMGMLPDLVLLDVMMPNLSGYDTLQQIRKTYLADQLPVILVTAKSAPEDKVKGFQFGANDYIVKPFDRTELMARIDTHLRLKRSNHKLTLMRNRMLELLKEKNIPFSMD